MYVTPKLDVIGKKLGLIFTPKMALNIFPSQCLKWLQSYLYDRNQSVQDLVIYPVVHFLLPLGFPNGRHSVPTYFPLLLEFFHSKISMRTWSSMLMILLYAAAEKFA